MLRELFNKHAATLCCRKDSTWPTLVHQDFPSSKPSFQLIYLSHPYAPTIEYAGKVPVSFSNSFSDTLCGSLVQYEGRIATIGLTFVVDGTSHMMTVDHLFNNSLGDENSLFTNDDEPIHRSSSRRESTSARQDTSTTPPSPHPQEKQNVDFGHSSNEGAVGESINASYTKRGPESRLAEYLVGQPIPLPYSLDPPAPYLDWAFVELNTSAASFQLPNIITLDSMSSPVLLRQVSKEPVSHTTSVYMISGINGTRKGCLFGGRSELGPLQNRSPCRAWKMRLDSEQGLEPGECGSIVVDQTTFDIYGHVIGSNIIGDVFVVPLADTIEQIRVAFNATTVTLPSQNLILPLCNRSEDNMTTQAGLSAIKPRSITAVNHLDPIRPNSSLGSFSKAQKWNFPEHLTGRSGQFNGPQTLFYPEKEDTSYLQTLKKTGLLDDGAEVPTLLLDYPDTRFTERSIDRIEAFCSGASFALDNFVSRPLSSSLYASSDTSMNPTATDSRMEIPYFAVVTDVGWCHNALSYISRDIPLASSLELNGILKEKINETQWWGSFQHHLRFQLPFFTLVSKGYDDPRTMSSTGDPLRTRLSLSFLAQSPSRTPCREYIQGSLCESVISFGIAVHSTDYWDVYCFQDGDTDTSIFGFDFGIDESGAENDLRMPEEMLRHSPRTFFLHTMSLSLDHALDQYLHILEVFRDFVKRQERYLSKSDKKPTEIIYNNLDYGTFSSATNNWKMK
ncbi:RNA-binding protein [Fusarium pseudoanthophilum]|uniref:RNA-binding protein n=1 Tax=Fusarium pseudoanthophilum TaxID=48495 RepID=A0A8H5KEM8_9HYPO|nr:RNA-binding protein [Fusarium pseudoanthophilum]